MDSLDSLTTLENNTVTLLSSEGEWSLHDLLHRLLSFTGSADVSIASFSISEEAVRTFASEIESGKIKTLRCLLDYTMRSHKVDLMLFLEMVATEVYTTPNHAKIIIIENDAWNVAVIGSANFTPNPRLEVACVFTTTKEFNSIKSTFNEGWNKAIPYS